jgi:Flp pilus assembly protein TadD
MKHLSTILVAATLIAGVNPGVHAKPSQTLLPQDWTKDLSQQGGAQLESGEYSGAIKTYNQALQLNASDASAYVGRGRTRLALGDKSGAIEDFTQALEINPNDASVYRLRGGVYLILGEEKEAREDFQRARNPAGGGAGATSQPSQNSQKP